MGPILENVLCNGTLLLLNCAAYPVLGITIDLCALLDCRRGRELPLISSVPSLWYALGTCSERCLRSTSVKEARDPISFSASICYLIVCLFCLFPLYFLAFLKKVHVVPFVGNVDVLKAAIISTGKFPYVSRK